MEIFDVVMKLIGPVSPVGETREDERRFENLKNLTDLTDKLLTEIDSVLTLNKNSHMWSKKNASDHCGKFLDRIGIVE